MLSLILEIKESGSSMECLVSIKGEKPTPQEIIYTELIEDSVAERLELIDKTYRVDNSHGQNMIQKIWSEKIMEGWKKINRDPAPNKGSMKGKID